MQHQSDRATTRLFHGLNPPHGRRFSAAAAKVCARCPAAGPRGPSQAGRADATSMSQWCRAGAAAYGAARLLLNKPKTQTELIQMVTARKSLVGGENATSYHQGLPTEDINWRPVVQCLLGFQTDSQNLRHSAKA
eukprot:6174562-Pleurochrysis_carterae.AAC.1